MSMDLPLSYGVFYPEEVELLSRVFEETLPLVMCHSYSELAEGLIASEIVKLAKAGERDPQRLKSQALAKLPPSGA